MPHNIHAIEDGEVKGATHRSEAYIYMKYNIHWTVIGGGSEAYSMHTEDGCHTTYMIEDVRGDRSETQYKTYMIYRMPHSSRRQCIYEAYMIYRTINATC